MRRKLSVLLILVMMIAMFPMTASAESENRVTNVIQIAANEMVPEEETYLVINDDKGDLGANEQRVRLTLTNAEWAAGREWDLDQFKFYNNGSFLNDATEPFASFVRVTDTRIDLTFTLPVGADEIRVPMLVEVGDIGTASVTVERILGAVTTGEYDFAEIVSQDAVITVSEVISFGPGETGFLGNIVIDETAPDALDVDENIRLTLSSGFNWAEGESFTVTGTGGFSGEVTVDQDDVGAGSRDMDFTLSDIGIDRDSSSVRGTLIFEGLAITSDTDNFGDVLLTFDGALGRESFEAAEFTDYDVRVEAEDDPETVVAGRFDGTGTQGFELAILIMEEEVVDSWIEGRDVTIEFPDWIQITNISGVTASGFEPGDSSFEFVPERATSEDRMEYEIEIEVTARADAEGDIVAEISGRGLNDGHEILLGEVVAPVTVDTGTIEILVSQRDHELDDIVIEETMVGGLMTGTLEIHLGIGQWEQVPTVTVDEGDVEIGDIEIDNGVLSIEIERESSVASTLIIEDPVLELLVQPLLGDHEISVGGDALVTNNTSTYFEDDDYVVELPVLTVVLQLTTAATTVSFTVGQNYYLADGERIDLDVAPYIKDARLMVPVAHVSRALGIPRDDVIWDGINRTVTVLVDSTVLQMAIGSQYLTVAGVEIDMEAAAEITNDRTFVPISRFARAMGLDYTWNPDTETVVFTQ